MADPTVKLVFSGNSADADRVLTGLERKVEGLEQKLKRLSETTRKGDGGGLEASLDGALNKMVGIAAAGAGVTTVLRGMAAESEKFNQSLDDFQKKQGEAELKLKIQGGFTPEQIKSQLPSIENALRQTPAMEYSQAISLQSALSGTGIKQEDIQSGAAFKVMNELRAVTNQFGKEMMSPEDSAKSVSQMLIATGSDLGAKDVKRFGGKFASLMPESIMQFEDLRQLSQVAGTLTQLGMTESQQLAAFTTLGDTQGSMVASTGMKNMALRLATAGTDKGQTDALASIGLKPADVAMSKGGLTFEQSTGRLKQALAGKSEVEKNIFLKEFFGQDAVSTAALALSDQGQSTISRRMQTLGDSESEFDSRLKTFQGDRAMLPRRAELEKEFALRREAAKGMTWGELQAVRESENTREMEAARGPIERAGVSYVNFMEGMADWLNKNMGQTVNETYSSPETGRRNMLEETMREQNEEIKKQTRLLEKAANGPQINRNAQVE